MQHSSIFTLVKKYGLIGLLLLLVLTGCTDLNEPINSDTEGWFNHYFVYTFSVLIKGLAHFLNDSYGLAIIIITLLIRLAVMPFMLKQTRSSLEMQDKMKFIKPELDEIQKKYKGKKDKESQMKMQQETMQLYQKHNFNPLASMAGCLPMLIQFPILIGFYYAIRKTPEIATHNFLWFNLGETDLLLTALAVIIYFLQFRVSQIGLDPQQKKQMAMIGLISPIMIGFVSLNAPAALPLYWAVGGLFIIVQTLISKRIFLAHKRQKEREAVTEQ
ncbi:Membrane protein insertase YidC [Lentibacillus sp. JNUCC-1]|uniref:membrane protein insertase YidC n=1 Tax=Lentibacillus sp. JNUCC-1 TaxID=2654513 RepID=UPI0012E81516|nr:membrane protein insertase YidC [Lentibacillus sp. JNUCC-1]MUV38631.1 Membrane protein insertase YidC [Lentibacillus sp. JNUCC-1]